MKLFLQLAVIAAFAAPVFAHATTGDISQPAHKVADDAPKKKKKSKGKKKAAAPADSAAPSESK